jgi:hypothetical protein
VRKVKELLVPKGGNWNKEKLDGCFYETDVANILKIPVGRAGSEDYIAWNYTKNGIFSVRSAYHLKQQIKQDALMGAGSSRNISAHQGWLSLDGQCTGQDQSSLLEIGQENQGEYQMCCL